jgi:hypothetical protein
VFLTFCQLRACVDAPPGLAPMKALRDMIFSNILIDNSLCDRHSALILVGLKGHPVENILLNNIHMITAGGGTAADASSALPDLDLEHLQGAWPEYPSFGRTVPCHGIYAGHLRGLTIRSTLLRTREKDERPAIFCDDVVGLELDGAGLENKNDGKSPVHLQDCPKAVIKKTDL